MYLIVFAFAFTLSYLLTPAVKRFALRFEIIDIPNQRSLHQIPVAKAGGLAIFVAFAVPVFLSIGGAGPKTLYLLLGAILILLTGFLDDLRVISPLVKLAGQSLAAAILIVGGIRIGYFPEAISIPLTLFWMVGITNAVNLLDGMDGLAAGVSMICALVFMTLALFGGNILIAVISSSLAGACLGFLRFNFHKASIFMGDTGSLLLGYLLGAIGVIYTMNSNDFPHLIIPVIVLFIPIFDTALAILRRILKRRPIFDADCEHFYEWLWNRRVLSYKEIVMATYYFCFLLGLAAIYLGGI